MTYNETGQPQANLQERLKKLDEVETQVMQIMQSAGGTLEELSKDVPSDKQIETYARNFRNTVKEVEFELNSHLNYLGQISAGLPYECHVYKETVELTLSAERLKNASKEHLDIDILLGVKNAHDSPIQQPVESDPNVTSTVDEPESVETTTSSFSDHTEVYEPPKPPLWRISTVVLDDTSAGTRSQSPSCLPDFEVPEFEFDEEIPDLEGNPDIDAYLDLEAEQYDLHDNGRLTPNGIIDEDYERELGWYEKELCIQEVIDSDFRDISRLGIVHAGVRDFEGRQVIAFFACRLPSSDLIDHNRLLEYLTKTLEQCVSSDYTLAYFHWGLRSNNKPKFNWLVKAYQTFGRSFKKNLKSLIIVYPTRTVKMLWNFFSPFVSVKMKRKLHYVNNLRDLEKFLPVCQLNLPLRIRDYDGRIGSLGAPTMFHPPAASVMGDCEVDEAPCYEHQQFGVSLNYIKSNNGGRPIPIVIEDVVTYLRDYGLDTPGIFVRPARTMALRELQSTYNRGEFVDLCEVGDPHVAAHLMKSFLNELKEPLLTFDLYDDVLDCCTQTPRYRLNAIRRLLVGNLPCENYEILFFIFKFLTEVLQHSSKNMVTAANVAVALGPSLVRSRQSSATTLPSPTAHGLILSFTQLCITHFEALFVRS